MQYALYCYLPLYVTCGRHLLVAKLRTSDRDASDGAVEVLAYLVDRIRARWPEVRILVRGDSGFAREPLIACPTCWGWRKTRGFCTNWARNS